MASIGRPSKLTKKIQDEIVATILRGAYIETAAAVAGINKTTFYDWLKRGRQVINTLEQAAEGQQPDISAHDIDCAKFANAIEKASAASELADVELVTSAAESGNWQASAWKLERKHHQRWGRKVAVTDHAGGNFFDGMARAWAKALESDVREPEYLDGEVERPLIEGGNGCGA
jgi:hypothetical protein